MGSFWVWVPIIYGASADLVANIYFPLTTGQLIFPGPILLGTAMAFFISLPMTVPAAIISAVVKGKRAHVLPVTSGMYAAALGAWFVWGPSWGLSRADVVVVFLLGPTAMLALVGWLRGRAIDAANASASPTS